MKTRVLLTCGLASVVVLLGSFMVRDREETLKPSVDYYLLQGDKSFTLFVSNLQKMEALIYIPKSRLTDVRNMGLVPLARDKAIALNKQLANSGDGYIQVYPSGSISEEVSLNFSELGMISYVKTEKASSKSADFLTNKIDIHKSYYKVESVSINAVKPEELQIKWEGARVSQAYVPVVVNQR